MKKILLVALILFCSSVFAQDQDAVLGKMDIQKTPELVKIIIPVEKGIVKNSNASRFSDPLKIALDILPAKLSGRDETIRVENELVKQVSIVEYSETTVRVTIDCAIRCEYKITQEATKTILSLTATPKEVEKKMDVSGSDSAVEKAALLGGNEVASSETQESEENPSPNFVSTTAKKGDIDQLIPYINLSNADLPALLSSLCNEAGFNLVTSKSVSGTIPSIQLKNVTLKKIFDLILKQNGFAYKIEGNIIRVATPAELKTEEENAILETRNFQINFAKAAEISTAIVPFLSSNGRAQADVRTNSLIVTDISTKLDVITEIMKKLDTKTAQVNIEAKLVDIKYDSEDALGIRWDVEGGGPTRPAGSDIYPPGGGMVFRGTVAPPNSATSTSGILQFGMAGSTNFWLALNALIRNNEANLLANPRITTLDNKTASIQISQAFTYISATDLQTGKPTYASVDAGVTLIVTPQINRNDYVTLSVQPTVSNVVVTGPPPIVDSRSANTTVLVKDGETLVIGGMIREDETVSITKVPFFGDIPLIGGLLFTSKDTVKIKRDLVVFMTPHIIK